MCKAVSLFASCCVNEVKLKECLAVFKYIFWEYVRLLRSRTSLFLLIMSFEFIYIEKPSHWHDCTSILYAYVIITDLSPMYCRWQVGSPVGLCLMEELFPTMTLKKMPGKDAREALKSLCVKYKVRKKNLCFKRWSEMMLWIPLWSYIMHTPGLHKCCITAIVSVHTKDTQLLIRFLCPPSSLVVHPSDFTRLDLIIPGEQYFYLRAINAAERQKWLVALGTAKACLTDNRTKREKGESCTKENFSTC